MQMMDSGGVLNEELEQLPPGFRFHPTDEELITYYLTHKISEVNFGARAIAEVDLTKCEPWDLPEKAKMGEKEWYFFSLRDRKYPTGVRTNRATTAGYWKTTGKDKEIFSSSNTSTSELVGLKKTLVFYRGRAPRGEKTNWVMHEYRLCAKYAAFIMTKKEEWVVCRVFMKCSSGAGRKNVPSNQQPRAPSNAYQIELGQYHSTMPCSIDKDSDFHFAGEARSYPYPNSELMDLTRLANGSHCPSLPLIQRPQLGVPVGGFSSVLAAGINLNLGAASTVSLPQIRATLAEQPPLSSGKANGTVMGAMDGGLSNQSFMDQFEGYWPSY